MRTKALERTARLVLNSAALLAAALAVAVVVGLLTGVRPLVFVSGSMSPHITTGALALIRPVDASEIQVGDVVSFERDDRSRVTHRVVGLERDQGRDTLVMQGDANKAQDGETYDITDGADLLIWHANGLGRLVTGVKAPIVIACAGALLVIALWPGRRPEPGPEQAPASADPR